MVDLYAIVRRLTGCELITASDTKALTDAVDGLIAELEQVKQERDDAKQALQNEIVVHGNTIRGKAERLAEPAGGAEPVQVGWAYRDKRWDEDRWHVCGWEKPREHEGREVRPIFIGTSPPDASAIREALERFDSVDPSESIGCYGGSGQWIELGTVADLRALAGAKP